MNEMFFINFGFTFDDSQREIVSAASADERFNEIFASLPAGGYASINKTYTSFDGTIEQGDCVKFLAK